mgnify:CR=1 FL=1
MNIIKLNETGYEEAALGFSLSKNSTTTRAKEILPKFAFGIPGENNFLEFICTWYDITAPRFWWQEFDRYRVGVSRLSESTMHTLTKRKISTCDFEYVMDNEIVEELNDTIRMYSECTGENKKHFFLQLKNTLPEGFLQRRIVMMNYKALKNIIEQRRNHRLPQWQLFCDAILSTVEHPEFLERKTEDAIANS